MFHPLVGQLSSLSDDELSSKISELSSKINMAHRAGTVGAIGQMQMIMSHYQEEYQRRAAQKLEELEKHSSSFKKIIDIK